MTLLEELERLRAEIEARPPSFNPESWRARLQSLRPLLDLERETLERWQSSLGDRGVPLFDYGQPFQPAGRALGEG